MGRKHSCLKSVATDAVLSVEQGLEQICAVRLARVGEPIEDKQQAISAKLSQDRLEGRPRRFALKASHKPTRVGGVGLVEGDAESDGGGFGSGLASDAPARVGKLAQDA